jgi:hypothetical protein
VLLLLLLASSRFFSANPAVSCLFLLDLLMPSFFRSAPIALVDPADRRP